MPSTPPPIPRPPSPVPPPRRSRLGVWLSHPLIITAIAGLAAVGVIGAYVAVFLLTAQEFTPTTSQKDCVPTAERLSGWFVFPVDPAAESWTGKKYADQSIEIEYEFDDPASSAPYIYSTLTVDRKLSDAAISYSAAWNGFKLGTNIGGGASISIVPADHIFSWGDASHFTFLESGGSNFGFGFISRKGLKTFMINVGGVALEDPAEVDAFLRPILENFERESF